MIKLSNFINENFTAVSNKTGKTVVFKNKDKRDAAIKSGTHSDNKKDGDNTTDSSSKPNMFSKDTGYDAPDAKSDNTPKVKPRKAKKALVKTVDKFSKRIGLTPDKLGREDYEKKMLTLVHDALEDANFHSANRQIFADLYGKPELAKRPDYANAPDFGSPERDEWEEKNSIYGKRFKSTTADFDDSDEMVGAITSQASWDGQDTIDAILDKIRKDGSNDLADKIQSSFDKDMAKYESSTKLGRLMKEFIDEGVEPQIKKIAYYTGTRPEAVEDFVSKYALNFTKLLKYVQKGGLPQRMDVVSALAGRPNNPKQKKIIKMFQESINEGPSTEEKRIAMLAVRKQAKYRNVSLEQAIQDQINALEDLKRDSKRGKLK